MSRIIVSQPLIVILAGGQGKKFAPLVTDKTLVPFLNKPILQHTLEMVDRAGFSRVLLAVNESNQKWIKNFQLPNLAIQTVEQDQALGMADALLTLQKYIKQQPIIVMNAGDIVDDQLLVNLKPQITDQYALICGMKVNEYFPGGYLQVQEDRVISIVEKPEPGSEPSDMANLVFHYFSQPQDFFRLLKEAPQDTDDAYEQALAELMKLKKVSFFAYEGSWQKLKYPFHVLDMMELFLSRITEPQIATSAQIDQGAIISGSVVIDEGTQVHSGAVIKGPAYIGPNAMIGNHALIRQSMIEAGSIVGFGSEVARSYIGPKTKLHHNFIGDSILEKNVNPSYGTCTANWRFDGKEVVVHLPDKKLNTGRKKFGCILAQDVFLGVGCTVLPGAVLAKGVIAYPNTVIHGWVPAQTTLKSYQKQTID